MLQSELSLRLADLIKLHPRAIDLSLGRLLSLLKKLNNPHLKLPPVIHIAGTNGKGSTQAFLKSILQCHGCSVHSYTSPHLIHYNERIEIKGKAIDDTAFNLLLQEVQQANDGQEITLFEIITATAFLAFSRIPADYLLLEVGLGGRFDATNVIETAKATVITPIAMDHEEFLGRDIIKIASEKAGIFKKNTPSYWAAQDIYIQKELIRQAQKVHCSYKYEKTDWLIQNDIWTMDEISVSLEKRSLQGQYQEQNAALALAVVKDILSHRFSSAKAEKGLQKAYWPARMQLIQQGAYKNLIPMHELWLDGAHNPHGAYQLAMHAKKNWQDRPLYLMFAMLNNRNVEEWISPFKNIINHAVTIPLTSTPNGHTPKHLKDILEGQDIQTKACHDMHAALLYLSSLPSGRVLMAGSLYMIGDFLKKQ